MDGGGRFAEPLTAPGPSRPFAGSSAKRRRRVRAARAAPFAFVRSTGIGAFERKLNDCSAAIIALNLPRGCGLAASVLIILSSIVYGAVRGGHLTTVGALIDEARGAMAGTAGLRVEVVALSGQKQLSRDDVLTSAGVTDNTSLLFFDVSAARARLKSNPWIADATVQKLYPDQLQISITEREPFALWQRNGQVWVISSDGIVLEPFTAQRFTNLPLVVGEGAEIRAKEFTALLDRYPEIRELVRACILVAERRWNLRLRNGIDVRLPESDVARALDQLAKLNRDHKLISRDVTAIDLRLPDRVTVRLSDAAALAREEALKSRKSKSKGDAV
jgi:cell division protein FtsQ